MTRFRKKLGKFSVSGVLETLNWLIDEVQRLQPRRAPGTLTSGTYKGASRSAKGGGGTGQTTQQTIPVARWQ